MLIETTVDIDASEFANDAQFCEIIEDIVKDTLRSDDTITEEVEGFVDARFTDYFDDHIADSSANFDPEDDDFINAVAKAIYNMARNYVGAQRPREA